MPAKSLLQCLMSVVELARMRRGTDWTEAEMGKLLVRLPGAQGRRGSMVLMAGVLALVWPASKAAAQATVDTHMPVSLAGTNPCTGELFQGSGFVHIKVYETLAPNFHVSMEENLESFQATTVTGVRYVAPLQAASHEIADTDFVPANATVEEMVQFIRQAEDGSFVMGDDFFFRLSAHFTYNGNGDLTASFSDMTTECR